MKTAMQELIEKIQYSIDKQSGLSITKEQENTLEAIKLVAENLLEIEKKQHETTFQFLTYDQRKAKIIANFNSIKVDPIKSQVTTTGVWTLKTN